MTTKLEEKKSKIVSVTSEPKTAVDRLIDAMKEVGIDARHYRHAPVGKNLFSMRLSEKRDSFWVWEGLADIHSIKSNKTLRQVCFTMDEKARVIEKVGYQTFNTKSSVPPKPDDTKYWSQFRLNGLFDVAMPPGTTYEVLSVEDTGNRPKWAYGSETNLKVNIRATTGDTINHFLVGYDEDHLFICALPEKPKSVTHAHELLRPKGLSKNALRQGEYFFEPVTDVAQIAKLNASIAPKSTFGTLSTANTAINTAVEPGTDHRLNGFRFTEQSTRYVQGSITHDRHETLHLNGWHKVVKNQEVVFEDTISTRSRTWD